MPQASEGKTTDLFFVARTTTPYRRHLLARLEKGLSCAVHDVTLADLGSDRSSSDRGDMGKRHRPWPIRRSKAEAAWTQIRTTPRPAVVVNGYNSVAFLTIIALCHVHRIPVFLRADSNLSDDHAKPKSLIAVKRLFLHLIRHLVDGVMPVGTQGIRYYQRYGFGEEEMFVVPYEIDHERLAERAPTEVLQAFRRRNQILPARRHIIYAGRLEPVKQVDDLFNAFAELSDEFTEWDLIIAGSGSRQSELSRILPARIRPRVHWLGWCDQDDLRLAYQVSEVFVLPSAREPWGVVVNEAIAAGLVPVVSDAVGAGKDLIVDTESGFVFSSGDRAALVVALRTALTAASGDNALNRCSRIRYSQFRSRYDGVTGIKRALHTAGGQGTRRGSR